MHSAAIVEQARSTSNVAKSLLLITRASSQQISIGAHEVSMPMSGYDVILFIVAIISLDT